MSSCPRMYPRRMRGCVHAFRRAPSCTAGRAVIRPAAVLPFAGTLVRMQIRTQVQGNPVVDEVSALVAVIRPILNGLLWGLKSEVAAQVGGPENVKLMMLARLVRPGDGDLGICFEYAVHNALRAGEQAVVERVDDALSRLCGVSGNQLDSILFAAEKTGSEQLINTARELITPESRLMSGSAGAPVKLHKHVEGIAQALRRPTARKALPSSIAGVWKADLFLGKTDSDRWVATTVKSNPSGLEGARGLRIGIVPANEAGTDRPFMDDKRRLAVCPLPYEGSFMETFYKGWEIVQQFLAADAKLPPMAALPRPPARHVADLLAERREFPVVDVMEHLRAIAQPELLQTEEEQVSVVLTRGELTTDTVIAPEPQRT